MLEYLEPFNCEQTIVILVWKQISSDSFRHKSSNKLTNLRYQYLNVWKQMSSSSFKNVIYKLYVYNWYIICMKRIWHGIIYNSWYAIKTNQTKHSWFDACLHIIVTNIIMSYRWHGSPSPPISIVHRFQRVFQTISCVRTELLWISSCWLSNS